MSRTIRRKNCWKASYEIVKKNEICAYDYRHHGTTDHDIIHAQSKAKFHRCRSSQSTMDIDCRYPKLYDRSVKQYNKQEIIRCLKNDCWDDFIPVKSGVNFGWLDV